MNRSTGLKRLVNATKYSCMGLRAAFKHEQAFRQETFVLMASYVIVMLIDFSIYERILLVGSVGVVMIVELVNSAIEAIVDRVSQEPHELSGRAKDLGSAAVFMSIVLTIILWVYLFSCHFFPE